MLNLPTTLRTRRAASALAATAAALLLAAGAAAATAPGAFTGPVSALGPTSATLNGIVNPNGTTTSWNFEYGTTSAYGTQTASQSAGSGTNDGGVSASLTGLSSGTTYHYRLDATSSAGTTHGSDGIFTTGAPPGAVTDPASNLAGNSATLNGSVVPNGQQTSYSFDYGTTTSYGTSTPMSSAGSGTTAIPVSASISGLQSGQTYHFRVVATSAAGTTQGPDLSFTLGPAPTVTTSAASSVSGSSAQLNGTVNPNGGQTSWHFDYGPTTSYGSSTASVSAGAGSQTLNVASVVTGLKTTTSYHFRLVATSAAGTTQGPDLSFTLGPAPTVTTSAASSVSGSSAQLNGTVNPNGGQTSWHFDYGPTTSYGSSTASVSAGAGSQTLNVASVVTGLKTTTSYHFRLVATSGSGTSTGKDRSFASSVPPTVQTGSAEGSEATSVILTGSVNPMGSPTTWSFQYGTTTSYGMSSSRSSAGAGSAARGVSVVIAKLQPGTTYHYRIVASSKAGTTDGGDVSFTTPAAVTLVAVSSQAVFGRPVTLQGAVSGATKGVGVTVLAEPFGQTSFTTLATVVTGAGGAWSYQARPALATSYEASTAAGSSAPVTIGVRPAITLRLITGARFLVRVKASRSFAGRSVKLQRLLPLGGWKTVTRGRLNARSALTVDARLLPAGHTTIRVAMSINQAGRGYLAGFSRTLLYSRR